MKRALLPSLLLALFGLGCGPVDGIPADEEPDGPTLYLDHCAGCHGRDARGSETGPDLRWRVDSMTADEVADVVQFGEGLMDPVDLDDAEAEAVASFLIDSLLAIEY